MAYLNSPPFEESEFPAFTAIRSNSAFCQISTPPRWRVRTLSMLKSN